MVVTTSHATHCMFSSIAVAVPAHKEAVTTSLLRRTVGNYTEVLRSMVRLCQGEVGRCSKRTSYWVYICIFYPKIGIGNILKDVSTSHIEQVVDNHAKTLLFDWPPFGYWLINDRHESNGPPINKWFGEMLFGKRFIQTFLPSIRHLLIFLAYFIVHSKAKSRKLQ